MDPLGVVALAVLGITVTVAVAIAIVTFNAVVAQQRRVDKAWANVDVALKQRWDELPNVVHAVEGVMAYERSVLEDVTRLRAAYAPGEPLPRQARTSDATTAAVKSLFAVVERYPEIRSAANVTSLQEEIERLEDLIATRREFYNDSVYLYNSTIGQLPAVVIAPLCGWTPRAYFKADLDETARPDVVLDRA